ncbi:nucleolar MIF4G domain-containing protein 1 [Xenopus laevis]|uniref:Nucleolar MIF4G domain-containing protein 1 n=3 Tax=Xenopus laevis TaxID=8355 RepID=A0A974HEY5_XENLA|nr:nucleolar MIF4G domain-containing protein 1 [Xenopus laevis]OCT75500.1 hypothetical protein XELAEV_18030680mg [Xenopus laevis]
MKRKAPGRDDSGRMKKLKLSVQEFVEKAEGSGVSGDNLTGYPGGKKKTRKELRKEKRQEKKFRRKEYYERRYPGTQEAQPPTAQTPDRKERPKGGKQGEKHGGKVNTSNRQEGNKPKTAKGESDKKPKAGMGEVSRKPKAGMGESAGKPKAASGSVKKSQAAIKEEKRRKALLEANEKEEKEIRRLEKSLRMNKRKNKSSLPQSFTQDGLDYILGMLEPGASGSGLYDDEDELGNTAEKLHKLSEKFSEGQSSGDEGDQPMDQDSGEETEGQESDEDQELVEEVEAQESVEEDEDQESQDEETDQDLGKKPEEHKASEQEQGCEKGQVPLGSGDNAMHAEEQGSKYIPPHLRQASQAEDAKRREELQRLKKSVKGLLNRLSEPNMASISGQLEELYMSNSRKDMNETLTQVLMDACITPARMPDRLMMEHVLLVSILHHTVGIEVGAHVLETTVKAFHDLYQKNTESKECDNLLILIGHLYNFHVMECPLLFDILKKLVSTFTEIDIELVLLLLKNVGFSLRKDDALALKELISEAQTKASEAGKKFQDQTRVKFMLETMLALKNNDMRKIPGYDPEPVEKLRKLQRSLVHGSKSGSDTRLRVSLENLLAADKVGRWWIVGSSWSGAPMIDSSANKSQQLAIGKVSSKIMDLARKQRMNTDIRRNIFCVLMTSEDYLDAFEKLLKLGLKEHQEREIVHVLIDCCFQEKVFNPFYAFLASKFCEYDRRFQMTFQFSMWDKFRDLGSLSAATLSNLVSLLSHLIKSKSLPLSIFKTIEFSELDKIKVSFLRQVLNQLLMDLEAEDLVQIFGKVSENPKLGILREGLKLFLTHFLLKGAREQKGKEDSDVLIQRVDLAVRALQSKENRLRL